MKEKTQRGPLVTVTVTACNWEMKSDLKLLVAILLQNGCNVLQT
jgi:hypothetical protein